MSQPAGSDKPTRVVNDSMIGLKMPDYARYSERVASVLGKNPGPFTGPGTNTYLVGKGRRPLLLDTGQGVEIYGELLTKGLAELSHSGELDKIVLTHAHVDHIGGCKQVMQQFGELKVIKLPWPQHDVAAGVPITAVADGDRVDAEGATLRAVFTPGHAPDHLCWYLEEERAVFTGDVVLGAGTTVIPEDTGDLGQYLDSLRRLLGLELETIYPAHGPVIREPQRKIREYIAHRELREQQILDYLERGPGEVMQMVRQIYSDVPAFLHQAAASSVRSHLKKLLREHRVVVNDAVWSLS